MTTAPPTASYTDLHRYLRVVRRSLWLMIACPVLAGVASGLVSEQLPPVYEAHVSLLVRPAQILPNGAQGVAVSSDQISRTYAQLLLQRPLLEKVVRDLNLGISSSQLAGKIKVAPQPNTTILDIAVDDPSPDRAGTIANTLTEDFIASIRAIQQQETTDQKTRLEDNLVVVSPAIPPERPISPNLPLNVAIAAAAGLLVALGTTLLREYLDQTIKSDEELIERTGLLPIGHIPFTPRAKGRRGDLVMQNGDSAAAEAYRALRTNLLFSTVDRTTKVIMVTSATPAEGKSQTTSNLAVALAQAGYQTLLIDGDFRRPSLHRILGRVRNLGMSNLTIQDVPEDRLLATAEGIPNLSFITSGPPPPNPSELLGSARMRSIIEGFRSRYHYVLIDTPPANVVTDAAVVATYSDAVVLVAESGRTTYPALLHAKDAIERVGGHITGVVINKVRGDGRHEYYGAREYGGYAALEEPPAHRRGGNDKAAGRDRAEARKPG